VNFGELPLPDTFDYPSPQRLDALVGEHGVSSGEVVVVDAQTFLIPDFSYDGKAPGRRSKSRLCVCVCVVKEKIELGELSRVIYVGKWGQ